MEDVWPREKDGGAFVAFSFVPPAGPFEAEDGGVKTPEERKAIETKIKATVEKETRDAMAARGSKPWWIFGESRAFLVKVREDSRLQEDRKINSDGKMDRVNRGWRTWTGSVTTPFASNLKGPRSPRRCVQFRYLLFIPWVN